MLNFSSVDVEKMAMDDIADESGSYSPLDSLPTSLRNISTESNVLLQAIIKDDVNEMEKQDKTNLVNWSLPVNLALTIKDTPEDQNTEAGVGNDEVDTNARFTGTFNALHVAIILESTKVFHYLLNNMPEEVLKRVGIHAHANAPEEVDVTERWIFQANCAHLAVKYMPTALQLLLTNNTSADLKDLKSEPFGTYPLHLAAMNNDALSTRILLRHKAKLEVQDDIGYTPLNYASRRNNMSIVSELLKEGANPFTPSKRGRTPLSNANGYECATLILNFMNEENMKLKGYETKATQIKDALVQSIMGNQFPDATEAILDSAIACTEGDSQLYVYDTDILSAESESKSDSNEEDSSGGSNEMHVHEALIDNGKSQLLLHPLIAMFLHIKWQLQKDNISCITNMMQNLLHVLLMSALGYVFLKYVTCHVHSLDEEGVKNCFTSSSGKFWCLLDEGNSTSTMATMQLQKAPLNCFRGPKKLLGCMETGSKTHWKRLGDSDDDSCFKNLTTLRNRMGTVNESFEMRCHKNFIRTSEDKSAYPLLPICNALGYSTLWDCWFSQGLTLGVMLTTFMILYREFREAIARGPGSYFFSKENIIQIIICLTSVGFVCLAPFHTELATHFVAWAIFFAWIDLTSYLGRFGIIGEYVYIMFRVAKTLLKCLIIFVPTLIAFSFGFSMLLHANPAFESWVSAGLKVMTMMLGELEFGDHFIYHEVKEIGGRNYSVQVMYTLFALMVAVVIMNLIVAMTISAADDLKVESEIIKAKNQVIDIVTDGQVAAKTNWITIANCMRLIYFRFFSDVQEKPKMVKEFLEQKKTKKVCLIAYQRTKLKLKLQKKKTTLCKPSTWPYVSDAYNAWCGGDYPLYSFNHQKGGKIRINANEKLVKQTQLYLAKKKLKREELEDKLSSIRDDLSQKWKSMEIELKQL